MNPVTSECGNHLLYISPHPGACSIGDFSAQRVRRFQRRGGLFPPPPNDFLSLNINSLYPSDVTPDSKAAEKFAEGFRPYFPYDGFPPVDG